MMSHTTYILEIYESVINIMNSIKSVLMTVTILTMILINTDSNNDIRINKAIIIKINNRSLIKYNSQDDTINHYIFIIHK
jgi:hypothetical protein